MEDLLKTGYINHPMQAYTLRRVTVSEGRAKGTDIIEICTAGGLQVDLLPDAGLDIGQVRFKGVNMSYICKNGYDSPAAIMPYETEFMNTYPGGLLYTSGLRTTGGAHRDGDTWHPTHGRYHSLQAEQVCTCVEDNTIIVSGVMRETALFGHALELKRTIRIPVFGSEITVTDRLRNVAHLPEEYGILYHCNFGYPFLSDKAHLEFPQERKVTGRTPFAQALLGLEHTFDAPVPGQEERVFFHEDMEHWVSLVNGDVGTKMTMTWSESLPILAHWRSMASGDYALGLEPTNTYIMGRKAERENGTLSVLRPFEAVEHQVKFSFESI